MGGAVTSYCEIAPGHPFHGPYHDTEYGFPLADDNALARLEGVYRSQGKHAAGIIVSAEPLANICPMIADKSSDEKIVGFEMESAEAIGCRKFDILGVAALDKLSYVNQLLRV